MAHLPWLLINLALDADEHALTTVPALLVAMRRAGTASARGLVKRSAAKRRLPAK
jgi:hypothetical protein